MVEHTNVLQKFSLPPIVLTTNVEDARDILLSAARTQPVSLRAVLKLLHHFIQVPSSHHKTGTS